MPGHSTPLNRIPVTRLKGVGPQLAQKLQKLGLTTIQDLLFHLPSRYVDRTRITPIGALQPYSDVVVEAQVALCDISLGRRRSLICKVQDNTGTLSLRFFHFSAAQKANLTPGTRLRCFGEVRPGGTGLEMYHPEYQFLDREESKPLETRLTPVYPAADGITQQRLRTLTQQALELADNSNLAELLTGLKITLAIKSGVVEALRFLHQPPAEAPIDTLSTGMHPLQQRLAFEELLAHHLSLLKLRHSLKSQEAPYLSLDENDLHSFLGTLAFTPTQAQSRVFKTLRNDLAQSQPMLRLVQGDVGSGKTLVAALAALAASKSGYQTAVMAPTEILAEQHRHNFEGWFQEDETKIAWLTGRVKGKARAHQLSLIASGEASIVIGTHALFQDEVQFHNLGLAIIDEQHRFGVHQRLSLRNKNSSGLTPHQLIMTATPIPRTLAMSAYGDLDTSVIDELPPGRSPVNTVAISQTRRSQIVERVDRACQQGRQAYWVCTLIEASETLEAQAAEATAAELRLLLPNVRIGLAHGRLKPAEKEGVMSNFKAGDIDLLVATTVIEVGVDVPNASLMVIENPERLGLSQLHQLRGRVGRGRTESYCVLLYGDPLSRLAKERIRILRETNDGFEVAEQDLKLRGPGEVLGTRQTGELQFQIADLLRDEALLPEVKACATNLIKSDPKTAEALIERWLKGKERYIHV